MSARILILGAGGFIGSRLANALAHIGEPIVACGRQAPLGLDARVECRALDLTDSQSLQDLLAGCRLVVHAASASTPGSSAGNAVAEIDNNLRPLASLLQAMQDTPHLPLVYLSSAGTLYAGTGVAPSRESDPVAPRSYHGAGKVAAEYFIGAWAAQCGGAATIIRPTNVYGPGQSERAGFGIVPAAFGRILRHEPLVVWGNGEAIRDYLYVDDLVDLCIRIIAQPIPPGCRIVNAGSGAAVSVRQLLAAIERITGSKLARDNRDARAVDLSRVEVDSTLAEALLGWRALTGLDEGLRRTWEWFETTQR